MNTFEELSDDLTVVMIAHRLSTVQKCDKLFSLKNGKVILEGKPSDILKG